LGEKEAFTSIVRLFLRDLLSSNIGEVLAMFFGGVLANLIGLQAGEGTVVLPGPKFYQNFTVLLRLSRETGVWSIMSTYLMGPLTSR
jgi:hypothetical protein